MNLDLLECRASLVLEHAGSLHCHASMTPVSFLDPKAVYHWEQTLSDAYSVPPAQVDALRSAVTKLLNLRGQLCAEVRKVSSQRTVRDACDTGMRNVLWSRTLYGCLLMCDTVLRRQFYAICQSPEGLIVTERQHSLLRRMAASAIEAEELDHLKLDAKQDKFVQDTLKVFFQMHTEAATLGEWQDMNFANAEQSVTAKTELVQHLTADLSVSVLRKGQLPVAQSLDHTYRRRTRHDAMFDHALYLQLLDPCAQERLPRAQHHAALWMFRLMSAACERKLIPRRVFRHAQAVMASALGFALGDEQVERVEQEEAPADSKERICALFGADVQPMVRLALFNEHQSGVFNWLQMFHTEPSDDACALELTELTELTDDPDSSHNSHNVCARKLRESFSKLQMKVETQLGEQTHDAPMTLFSDAHIAELSMELLLRPV